MSATSPRKYTVLTSDQWTVVIEAYKLGTNTIKELSDTYGVSPRSIQNKVKEAGATRNGGFTAVSASPAVAASMSVGRHTALPKPSGKPLTATQRQKTTEDRIDQVIESAIVHALNIEHATNRALAVLDSATSTPDEMNRAAGVLRSLERAAMIFDRSDRAKRRALLMDSANASVAIVLPDLPIRDMTAGEVQALRQRQAQEDNGMHFDDEGNPIIETPITCEHEDDDDRVSEGCDD